MESARLILAAFQQGFGGAAIYFSVAQPLLRISLTTHSASSSLCHSVACSYAYPTRRTLSSPNAGPSSCRPMGSRLASKPHGTERPQIPARLGGSVNTSSRDIATGASPFSPVLKADVRGPGPGSPSPGLI